MATITVTIPDAQVPRILDAFAATYDYDRYVQEGGTATRAEFARQQLIRWMKSVVRAYEVQQQRRLIEETVPSVVDPDLT